MERHPFGGALLHGIWPALYTAIIFVKGSAHADPSALKVNDKVAHAVVFFGLVLVCAPLAGHYVMRGKAELRGAILWCAFYAAAIGAGLELWQSRLPHRSADVWDWVADAVGVGAAAWLLSVVLPRYVVWRTRTPG